MRVGSIVVVTGGLVLAATASASAHVTMTPSTTAAGAYSVLTFSVGHGCEGSPTTRIAIQLPDQLNAATPTRTANWTVEKAIQQLDEPIVDAHGNELTERVGEIVYEAEAPLPDGYRDTFEVQVQLPEAGENLVFPVVQTCEKGETAWVEVPAEGQSEDDLEAPAPMLTVTEATGEDEHGGSAGGDHADDATRGDDAANAAGDDAAASDAGRDSDDGAPAWVGWTALALGAVGVVAGGAALARARKG